ncbi:MAG TPA: DUF1045 domain-containing protein [Devosia sp.]|nr:DUF1045 domain-containing protein [Devosia sp.]
MPERFALYYAPPASHPIWPRAAQWLGRDPLGEPLPPAAIAGIEAGHRLEACKSARRYGFHATLKAPMALAPGTDRRALEAELRRFSDETPMASIGRLRIANLDGFLALIPEMQSDALTRLAGEIVTRFEPFRAPLGTSSREKRIRDGRLTERQIAYLDTYGYPYVLDEFRFHMTLTDRLSHAERPGLLAAATAWFEPVLDEPFMLDRIALFHETEAGAPFSRLADFPLLARSTADA